jgi:hypothetical protein
MTTIIDGTAGITFPNSTVQASAGQVLQVINAITATQVSSSSATFVDTGLTATITPKFSTSKILVLVSQNGLQKTNGSADNCIDLRLLRGATNLLSPNFGGALSESNAAQTNVTCASICYLDSPATTSATTYKTQFASRNNTASVTVQYANISNSTITLLEIAA